MSVLKIKDQNGNWIQIPTIKGEDGQDYVLTESDKQEIAGLVNAPVGDVQVNGISVITGGVANIPIASANDLGVIKVGSDYGIGKNSDNRACIQKATDTQIKNSSGTYRPITPDNQHNAVFYGLAKASGDTTQSASDNTVGTYTDGAKSAIQTMLGVPSENDVITDVQIDSKSIISGSIANIPKASNTTLGVVKINSDYGLSMGTGGILSISAPSQSIIKTGTNTRRPIVPNNQHEATFYGLAKAAGVDEKNSTLSFGTYTDSAQIAIKQMLGVKDDYDSLIVEVSGTDPVITGKPSYRYNCGELYTLTVTPPASGTMDIIFTSGTTPTVLSLPNTVKMPDWWAGIETNTTYEMCITDGTYCGVMSWAT